MKGINMSDSKSNKEQTNTNEEITLISKGFSYGISMGFLDGERKDFYFRFLSGFTSGFNDKFTQSFYESYNKFIKTFSSIEILKRENELNNILHEEKKHIKENYLNSESFDFHSETIKKLSEKYQSDFFSWQTISFRHIDDENCLSINLDSIESAIESGFKLGLWRSFQRNNEQQTSDQAATEQDNAYILGLKKGHECGCIAGQMATQEIHL